MKVLEKVRSTVRKTVVGKKDGVIGYGIAWLLGVPVSVLVLLYLVFGR